MQNTGIKAGQDTLILNDVSGTSYLFTSIGSGDCINLEFTDDIVTTDITYSGAILSARNANGSRATLTVMTPVSSADDLMLEQYATSTINNFVNTPFLIGSYSRISNDTNNNLTTTVYTITGGTIQKVAGMKTNSTGDSTQMMSTWVIGCLALRQSS